ELPGHIPSLAELYRSCGTGFELSLDLKDPAALQPVLASAAAAGATGRLWLCHHDWRLLAAWRVETGDAQLVHSTRRRDMTEGSDRRAAILAGAGLAAINLRAREWTPGAVAAVHHHGLAAFGWDAQSEDALRRAVLLGLDGVYCDHVARMVSCLAEA
ncbi:MAG: glycerophosphodiester phosphodiesterase, partial [Acidimicrobiales bacterium]